MEDDRPLFEKSCGACKGKIPLLSPDQITQFLEQLPEWQVEENKFLLRSFHFNNFVKALKLANDIGQIAEVEQHHPDLLVRFGELKVMIWTHAVNGLTESDFILAAKIDRLVSQ